MTLCCKDWTTSSYQLVGGRLTRELHRANVDEHFEVSRHHNSSLLVSVAPLLLPSSASGVPSQRVVSENS